MVGNWLLFYWQNNQNIITKIQLLTIFANKCINDGKLYTYTLKLQIIYFIFVVKEPTKISISNKSSRIR